MLEVSSGSNYIQIAHHSWRNFEILVVLNGPNYIQIVHHEGNLQCEI